MQPTRRWQRAVVTGASSGIGEAFARLLAAEGTDVVLVARDEERLRALAAELRGHAIEVEVMAIDLTVDAGVREVEQRLAGDTGRPVDLLVNNAGVGSAGLFWELSAAGETAQVMLNAVATARLTHAALAAMVARGAGTVVNVGSLAGTRPCPTTATYGATKAFVEHLGSSLHEELVGTGVTLTTVLPGNTATEFHQRAGMQLHGFLGRGRSGPFWSSPDAVARQALDAAAAGRSRVVPGLASRAVGLVVRCLPDIVMARAIGIVTRRIRRRARS